MIKLAYLVTHPIQYQAPLLRLIAEEPGIDLTVFFVSDFSVNGYRDNGFGEKITWDVPLLDGYYSEFLPAFGPTDGGLTFFKPFTYGLIERLRKGRFDVLWVHGYGHVSHVAAVLAAQRLGIKVLMRGESNMISAPRSAMKKGLKDVLIRSLFAQCDGFLCIGSLNREYYRHYGVSNTKLFMVPYSVDNSFFQQRVAEARVQREEFRQSLGLDSGRPVILYASKLMERKHPMDVLEAYIRLSPDDREPTAYLLFVGNGEERERLEERAKSTGWNSIRFLGFQNQTRLPAFYDLCDVFVLPSNYEPWGLVVNEVMNAGKPVVVSDQVGCAPDLVRSGENGFVVPVRDITAMSAAFSTVVNRPAEAARMGRQSLERISQWGFREDVEGLMAALRAVMER